MLRGWTASSISSVGIPLLLLLLVLALQSGVIETGGVQKELAGVMESVAKAGIFGPVLHCILHAFAIIICFPGTILFEIAAGFLYGLVGGVCLVVITKGVAASLCFLIARSWAQVHVRATVSKYAVFQKLVDGVARDKWRFVLLARLSPIPSWLNNYGLALTQVSYRDFILPTLLGGIPTIAQNVFLGSTAATITDTSTANPWLYKLLMAVSVVVSFLLVAQIVSYVTARSELCDDAIDGHDHQQHIALAVPSIEGSSKGQALLSTMEQQTIRHFK